MCTYHLEIVMFAIAIEDIVQINENSRTME